MELNLPVLVVHKLNISERILDIVKIEIYNYITRNSIKPAWLYLYFDFVEVLIKPLCIYLSFPWWNIEEGIQEMTEEYRYTLK